MSTLSIDGITTAELARLGWAWGDAGVILGLTTPAGPLQVFIPLRDVWAAFRKVLPLPTGIGCPASAIGFWGRIKRAARSVSRGVKSVAKKVVPKAVRQAAASVVNQAAKAVRVIKNAATSDIAAAALVGLSFVPGMAPLTLGALAAQQALKKIDVGVRAAQKLVGGAAKATPAVKQAIAEGQVAKELVQQVTRDAADGKRVASGFAEGLAAIAQGVGIGFNRPSFGHLRHPW